MFGALDQWCDRCVFRFMVGSMDLLLERKTHKRMDDGWMIARAHNHTQNTYKYMKRYLKSSVPSVPFLKEEAAVRVAEQKKKQVTSPENYRQLTLTSEHAVDKCLLTGNLLGEAVQNHNNSDCSSPKMWIGNLNNDFFFFKSKPQSFFPMCLLMNTVCHKLGF